MRALKSLKWRRRMEGGWYQRMASKKTITHMCLLISSLDSPVCGAKRLLTPAAAVDDRSITRLSSSRIMRLRSSLLLLVALPLYSPPAADPAPSSALSVALNLTPPSLDFRTFRRRRTSATDRPFSSSAAFSSSLDPCGTVIASIAFEGEAGDGSLAETDVLRAWSTAVSAGDASLLLLLMSLSSVSVRCRYAFRFLPRKTTWTGGSAGVVAVSVSIVAGQVRGQLKIEF